MDKLRFTWFVLLSIMTVQTDAIETGEFDTNFHQLRPSDSF